MTHSFFFLFNDTPTTQIYTLSLHDALPISMTTTQAIHRSTIVPHFDLDPPPLNDVFITQHPDFWRGVGRSEEHTSELQSLRHLVCRLLLEKKKITSRTWSEIYQKSVGFTN